MTTVDDNWDYHIDFVNFEKNSYAEFLSKASSLNSNIDKLLENDFKSPIFSYKSNITDNQSDCFKDLVEKNKELRVQIDNKLEEISQQQIVYETYKKDQKLLTQEIKESHEAFLMAKKYYKKFLKTYFTIESRNGENQIVFVQFFTEAKKDSDNYAARLQRNTKTGQYQLLSTCPKVSSIKDLQKQLLETNDVPGALCSIRKVFIHMKKNKK